jgi:Tol biopolymer transport system component/DNA-binding winged helix-turn-helix (wHTH) protein
MLLSTAKIQHYLFGEFRLDPNSYTFYKNEIPINLNRIRSVVLLSLIERAGEVVTREEIIKRVWPDQEHLQSGETNLAQQIFQLRRFLHDNPSSPTYILTIPSKGYLFYPSVRVILTDGSEVTLDALAQQQDSQTKSLPEGLESTQADETVATAGPVSYFPLQSAPQGGILQRLVSSSSIVATLLRLSLIAASILLSAFLIKYWFLRGVDDEAVKESSVGTLISRPGRKEGLAYSPDGKMLAFLDEGKTNDTVDLFTWRAGSNDIVQLTDNPLLEKTIAWSPDNQQLAFLRWVNDLSRKYSIFTVPAFGGPERKIGEAIDGLDWDPSGRYLAISDDEGPGTPTGIYLLSVDGSERMPISRPNPGTNLFDFEPKFSPNGREIVFTRWSSASSGEIFIADRQTGQIRQLTFDQKEAKLPKWSRNGQEILFISNRNGNWRVWRISNKGGLPRLVESIAAEVASFSLSQSSNEIAFVERFDDSDLQLHWLNHPSGEELSEPPCAANSTRPDHSPRFSPDGNKVAFVSKRTGVDEMWITDPACQKARQLTNFGIGVVGSPQWSPDGKEIVFDFFNNNHADIYKIDLLGGQLRHLTDDPGSEYLPSWSNDGQWIYFSSDRPGMRKHSQRTQIWKIPASGGEAIQVTENGGQEPVQSHDGRQLFYIRDDNIWTKELPAGREKRIEALSGFILDRYWTLNRTNLFLLVPEQNGISRLISLDLKTQQLRTIHEVSGSRAPYVSGLSISADERRIAVSLIDKSFSNIAVIRNWE